MNRFLYYFTWTFVIGIIIYFGLEYRVYLEDKASMEFSLRPVLWFSTLFPVVIGMLLRLPKLIREIKEKRQWTFDWIKVVAIALPALFIVLIPISLQTPIGASEKLHFLVEMMMSIDHVTFITTAGIVFGYVLLDSLKE